MTSPKVTIINKRCKSCVFWQHYNGHIENAVMQRMFQSPAPRRKPHACLLVLRDEDVVTKNHETGEETKTTRTVTVYPSGAARQGDRTGPRFGERTGPKDGCVWHRPNHAAFVTPEPTVEDGGTVLIDEGVKLGTNVWGDDALRNEEATSVKV